MDDHYVQTSVAKIRYRTFGHGRPVVLIHGLGGCLSDWDRLIPLLTSRRRTVALDLPGFGRSEKPEGTYDLKTFNVAVTELMGGLNLQHPILAGHSLGGRVVLSTALRHPELAAGLVLICSSGGIVKTPPLETYHKSLELRRRATQDSLRRMLELAVHDPGKVPDDLVQEYHRLSQLPGSMKAYEATVNRPRTGEGEDLAAALTNLRTPLLIIAGRQDRNVPWTLCEKVHHLVEGSEFRVIDECGHMPMLEQPGILAGEILRFTA